MLFGPFRYDPEQRVLFRDGKPVPLLPKAVDTLHVLLEHHGRIVEKADLMRLVWPDTTVEEVGLARNVSILRKALGDEADQAVYIETVPRRGYRFIAGVRTAEVETAGPLIPKEEQKPPRRGRGFWIALASAVAVAVLGLVIYWQFYAPGPHVARGAMASVAVVPFEPVGTGPDLPAFSRGLEESLAAALSQSRGLAVISPGTVHRYHDKGVPVAVMSRVLRLDAVLEGTVQRSGATLRISARLADVHSGRMIWGESYNLDAADPAGAQAEASRRIALAVAEHLLPQ